MMTCTEIVDWLEMSPSEFCLLVLVLGVLNSCLTLQLFKKPFVDRVLSYALHGR